MPKGSVTMFTMAACPYCRAANRYMEALFARHSEYAAVPLTVIDEVENAQLADQFDYYYVPTYYVGTEKVHEGAVTQAQVECVFRRALAEKGS